MEHTIRHMAGGCATGRGRSRIKWHAVIGPVGNGRNPPALCGKTPTIQWSDDRVQCERPEQPVTCPQCLKRLPKATTMPIPDIAALLAHANLDEFEPIAFRFEQTCKELSPGSMLNMVQAIGELLTVARQEAEDRGIELPEWTSAPLHKP